MLNSSSSFLGSKEGERVTLAEVEEIAVAVAALAGNNQSQREER